MSIKSRSLLPREEINLEEELDPQDELIQRLIEYRRFRGAADDLEGRFRRRSMEHLRGFTAWVERPGTVKPGDTVAVHVPGQAPYPHR